METPGAVATTRPEYTPSGPLCRVSEVTDTEAVLPAAIVSEVALSLKASAGPGFPPMVELTLETA